MDNINYTTMYEPIGNPQEAPIDITKKDVIKKYIILRYLKKLNKDNNYIFDERILEDTMNEYIEQPKYIFRRFKPYQILACLLYKQCSKVDKPFTDQFIANFIGIILENGERLYTKYYTPS